jgi:trehalose-phosphatase
MKVLDPRNDPGKFWESLRRAATRALLLDYDGTLAPFHVDPAKAVPYPGVSDLLDGILGAGRTTVVLITGRPAKDLLPLLDVSGSPEIWGCHGWERLRANGSYELAPVPPRALEALEQAILWIGSEARCEHKPAAVAVHWRGLDRKHADSMRDRAMRKWPQLAQEAGLVIKEFDGGIELRVSGRDKGFAVNAVLSEMGGEPVAAYLGDDTTDEDAFQALQGRGLAVLVRGELRPTAAGLWIRPPEELLDFLARWRTIDELKDE